jgi:hypothetical protein
MKIVSNFKHLLEWGSSGSKHPPKSKNKCGSAKYKQFFDLPHVQSTVLCCGICSPCLLERGIMRKRLGICWEFCDFGLLALVCDVHCVLSLVLV